MPKLMPPPGSRKDEPADRPGASTTDAVEDLVVLLAKVTETGSFKSVQADLRQVEELRGQVASLNIAFEQSAAAVGRKQAEIDEGSERYKEVVVTHQSLKDQLAAERKNSAAKDTQIKTQESQLRNLITQTKAKDVRLAELQNIESARDALEDRIETTKSALESRDRELAEATRTLQVFRSLSAPFKTILGNELDVSSSIDQMFRDASQLLGGWLRAELDEACLSDVEKWDSLRDHQSVGRTIPLPPSNSNPAKAMRVTAGLSIYGKALARHIMKPTYLLKDDESLHALDKLVTQNPLQGAGVRAVLLEAFPDMHRRAKEMQVKLVVEEVVETLGWCARGKKGGTFHTDVEDATAKIADAWELIQTLEETVRPSFRMEFSDDWTPLPTQPADAIVVEPVWPSFLCIGSKNNPDELLHAGYGITEGQMDKARDEFSRRAQRKTARQSGSLSKQRRASGSFLAAGGSNGHGNE